MLFAAAHGLASMESSGHLRRETWRLTSEDLVDMAIAAPAVLTTLTAGLLVAAVTSR